MTLPGGHHSRRVPVRVHVQYCKSFLLVLGTVGDSSPPPPPPPPGPSGAMITHAKPTARHRPATDNVCSYGILVLYVFYTSTRIQLRCYFFRSDPEMGSGGTADDDMRNNALDSQL